MERDRSLNNLPENIDFKKEGNMKEPPTKNAELNNILKYAENHSGFEQRAHMNK